MRLPARGPDSRYHEAMELRRTESGAAWRRWPGRDDPSRVLVLVHGLASNGSRWAELAETICCEPGWTVLAPDLRGHGESERRGRIDSSVWIRDLLEILSAEALERCVIGGHCLGANLALRFAHAHPDRAAALVLVEPMLPEARVGKVRHFARFRFLLPILAIFARGLNLLGIKRKQFPELDLRELDKKTRKIMAEQESGDAITRRYAAPIPDMRFLPVASYLQALDETLKPLPALDEIHAPCLALLSAGGLFGDPERTRRALARMPRTVIHTVDARHWIPTEAPGELREHLVAWLKRFD